jgi:tetratricopeptide (TPR) repeat protein/O-antigen ligase
LDPGARGGLRVASLFFLFALSVLASGKYYQYVLGFLRGTVFLAAGVWFWRPGRTCREIPPYAVAVAGFSALSLGHAFSSVYFWVSFQHSLNILLAAVLLIMAIRLFHEESKSSAWKLFLPILALLGTLEIVIAVHQRLTLGTSRPYGTFSNPMFFSEFLSISALFFASRLLGEWGTLGRRRIVWGVGAVFFLAGALSLTGSRGVVVALVPALGILAISHFGITRGGKVFLLILPGLILLGWHSISRFFSPDVYNYGRWVFWRSALRVFKANPFGVGLGGYKYHWFATQEPFLHAFRRFGKYAITPHNEYLEVLSGLGFAGLILFCVVLFLPLWYAAREWKGVPEDRRWIAAGALAGLVLTGTNALFNFNFHEFGVVFTDVLLLGILWTCLPESAMGKRLAIPPILSKAGAAFMVLLGLASITLLAGAVAMGRGESLVREKDYASAEKTFRVASVLDPWRATIPDALSALYHRRFVAAYLEKDPGAGGLLLLSIRWQEKARELCPMEQGFLYRLADLFLEKYRVGGERRDLETALALTGEILRINPYGVEALWNRTYIFLNLGRPQDAGDTLQRAVIVEPNFCRGYAKLAELTKGKDESQLLAWETRAVSCRETARGRTLEENERWLVEEPESRSKTAVGRSEDGEPDLPSGFSPSR